MPQMMPIWWSILLVLSLLFFLSINAIVYFMPLLNLHSVNQFSSGPKSKLINTLSYDL